MTKAERREMRQGWVEDGKCWNCGRPRGQSSYRCDRCLAYQRAYKRQRYGNNRKTKESRGRKPFPLLTIKERKK